VQSGTQAHGVVERIPGAVAAVQQHEESGEVLRSILTGLAILELMLLVPAVAPWRKWGRIAAALVGVWAAAGIYYAGHQGGELVYKYAGGVGTRSGDSTDVNRVVLAALYNRAMLSRTQGNAGGAAAGFQDLAARFPQDETVQILAAESLIQDRKDYAGALAALAKLPTPPDTARIWLRFELARADAYLGAGQKDSARMILEPIGQKMPTNKRVQDRLTKAK
ncbi:MAG: hypothetical protein U9Q74_00635, partial [Gemmatimonadota bacterium]|nr:hypothetical protein [Gemmatimonadota bacterium]